MWVKWVYKDVGLLEGSGWKQERIITKVTY